MKFTFVTKNVFPKQDLIDQFNYEIDDPISEKNILTKY